MLILNRARKILRKNLLIIILSTILGIFVAYFCKEGLTTLFFPEKDFLSRSFLMKVWLILGFWFISTISFCFLFFICNHFFPNFLYALENKLIYWQSHFQTDKNARIIFMVVILVISFSSLIFINNVFSPINTETWKLEYPNKIPSESIIGFDFRIGSYVTARNLVDSQFTQIRTDGSYASLYPPLVNILNIPFLLLSENNAYVLEVILLFLSNITCLILVSLMVRDYLFANAQTDNYLLTIITIFLFFIITVFTLTSYPFLFSIERGNTDIFALTLATLALWVYIKMPEKVWLQIILLSIATHLKIYPSILFLLLLAKHGKKIIIPSLVLNVAFLFILGPKMALSFFQTMISNTDVGAGIGNKWPWVGNHAAYSLADMLTNGSSKYPQDLYVMWGILTLVPLVFWGLATWKLIKKNPSPYAAVLYFMICIPLMDLLPTVAMDYKLVILNPAILILVGLIFKQCFERFQWFDIFQLFFLTWLLLYIGRTYEMSHSDPYLLKENASLLLNNKYVWVLGLEAVMLVNIFRDNRINNPKAIRALNP